MNLDVLSLKLIASAFDCVCSCTDPEWGGGVYGHPPPRKLQTGGFCKNNIRFYYECEGRIEKSVPRIAVWHHEACRVMTNCDPEGQIFLSFPHTNKRLYF